MDADRRTCEICNVTIHRASMAKHMRSKKHLENMGKKEKNQETVSSTKVEPGQKAPAPVTVKPLETVRIPPTKREKDRDYAKRVANPYFLDEELSTKYKVNLIAHNQSDLNSMVSIKPMEGQWMNEDHFNRLIQQICNTYARIIGQSKFKVNVMCNVLFDQFIEETMETEELEMVIRLKMINVLTPSDITAIDVRQAILAEIEEAEMRGSGWRLNKIVSMDLHLYKTNDLSKYGATYVKLPFESKSLLNVQNTDKYCFVWCVLASLYPVDHGKHPNRVSNYFPYFNNLNLNGFDFREGFKTSDVKRFEKMNCLNINIFELTWQWQSKSWALVPIESSDNAFNRTHRLTYL